MITTDNITSAIASYNTSNPLINGTGFVKSTGTTISYDNNSYVIANSTITANTTGALVKYDAKGLVTSAVT